MITESQKAWKEFFTPEAFEEFGKAGYYKTPLKSKNGEVIEGAWFIGFNSENCYVYNRY